MKIVNRFSGFARHQLSAQGPSQRNHMIDCPTADRVTLVLDDDDACGGATRPQTKRHWLKALCQESIMPPPDDIKTDTASDSTGMDQTQGPAASPRPKTPDGGRPREIGPESEVRGGSEAAEDDPLPVLRPSPG